MKLLYIYGSVINVNILPILIILIEIIVGIILLKYKSKVEQATLSEDEMKTIAGVALLFTIITSVFYILENIVEIRFYYHMGINWTFYTNFLWLIVAVAIISYMIIYNRKLNQSIEAIIRNEVIRKGTGLLFLINGLISLSINLPPSFELIKTGQLYFVISTLLLLCMIIVGLFLTLYNKKIVSGV